MTRIFIVLPDISEAKCKAIHALSERGKKIDVLLSYTTFLWKRTALPRLKHLRRKNAVGHVMLDSGAYHLMRLGSNIDVKEYAGFVKEHKMWDFVIAPDVPGNVALSLERSIVFSHFYDGKFVPVLQGESIEDYVRSLELYDKEGLVERAPIVNGRPLLGIGGLDGYKKRLGFIIKLLEKLRGRGYLYHLFGVGIRILKGLSRRGLIDEIYSVDSSGWLAEIQWRRRTVYNAVSPVEANMTAITGYLARAEAIKA